MSLSPQDQRVLSCLRQAKEVHQDLVDLLSFYEELFQMQFTYKGQLKGRFLREGPKPTDVILARLEAGIPQLDFDDLNLSGPPFQQLFRNILGLLVRYADSPPSLTADPEPVTVLEYAREIFLSRAPLVPPGQPDLIRTSAGLAMAPCLQEASQILIPLLGSGWLRGFCPVCGGPPSFGVLNTETGTRILFCSRCNGEWSYRRLGCPFCEGSEPQTYHLSEDERYRLYLCEVCRRYLKTIDLGKAGSSKCLPVECLITVSMDIAAQERGYRPS